MGHDINNMHQIALGYLELARDMHPEAGQSEFLDKPIEVLQRSAQLIRNVRKLQKLKEGVFQTQDGRRVPVARRRAAGVRGGAPQGDHAEPERVRAVAMSSANELLHDVFANLVSNAIKHTGDRADIVVDLDVV